MFVCHCAFWCGRGSRRWLKIKNSLYYLKHNVDHCAVLAEVCTLWVLSCLQSSQTCFQKLHSPQICGLMCQLPVQKQFGAEQKLKWILYAVRAAMANSGRPDAGVERSAIHGEWRVSSLCVLRRSVYYWTPLLLPRPSSPSSYTRAKNTSPSITSCQQHAFT